VKYAAMLSVVFVLGTAGAAPAREFTWDNMLLVWMRLSDDFDPKIEEYIDSYLKIYRPHIWKAAQKRAQQKDDKVLKDLRAETIKIMQKKVKALSGDTLFVLRTRLVLGDYDAATKAFPLLGNSEHSLGANNCWCCSPRATRPATYEFPRKFRLLFTNAEAIPALAMQPAEAERFLAERKGPAEMKRSVYATITFKIVRTREGANHHFRGEIQSVTLHDCPRRTKQLAAFKDLARARNVAQTGLLQQK